MLIGVTEPGSSSRSEPSTARPTKTREISPMRPPITEPAPDRRRCRAPGCGRYGWGACGPHPGGGGGGYWPGGPAGAPPCGYGGGYGPGIGCPAPGGGGYIPPGGPPGGGVPCHPPPAPSGGRPLGGCGGYCETTTLPPLPTLPPLQIDGRRIQIFHLMWI